MGRTVAEAEMLPGSPDLLLLDLGLPDGDGLDLCRRLCDRHTRMRTIILTARTGEIDVVLGLDAGAIDYIAKPFRFSELLARIRAQLRDRHGERIAVGDLVVERDARRLPRRPRDRLILRAMAAQGVRPPGPPGGRRAVVAVALLLSRARRGGWVLSIGVALGPLIGYALSRGPGLPLYTDDRGNWNETIGVVSLVIEGLLLLLAVAANVHAGRSDVRRAEPE